MLAGFGTILPGLLNILAKNPILSGDPCCDIVGTTGVFTLDALLATLVPGTLLVLDAFTFC